MSKRRSETDKHNITFNGHQEGLLEVTYEKNLALLVKAPEVERN